MLTKYGTSNIIVMLTAAIVMLAAGYLVAATWLGALLYAAGALLLAFTLNFFRDPRRTLPPEGSQAEYVISPCDGKVMEIIDVDEKIFIGGPARQISVFLSPLDVHVNRIPFSGTVKHFEYIPGKFLVAFNPKASLQNEQTHIGVESPIGRVFFKQIVGIVARRLAWDIKTGDTVKAGAKFGMMKFGSRMDIIVPIGTELFIKEGMRVVAGETIMAKLSSNNGQ